MPDRRPQGPGLKNTEVNHECCRAFKGTVVRFIQLLHRLKFVKYEQLVGLAGNPKSVKTSFENTHKYLCII